jgi:hypothetical protein
MKTTRLVLTVMTLFAADTNAGTKEQLAAYRQQIDSLDQRIRHPIISVGYVAIRASYAGKKRYWRTHDSAEWTSGGGNCAVDASWFHDRRTGRADRVLRRTSWVAAHHRSGIRATSPKHFFTTVTKIPVPSLRSSAVSTTRSHCPSYTL